MHTLVSYIKGEKWKNCKRNQMEIQTRDPKYAPFKTKVLYKKDKMHAKFLLLFMKSLNFF